MGKPPFLAKAQGETFSLLIVDLRCFLCYFFNALYSKLDLSKTGLEPGIVICVIELENGGLVYKKLVVSKTN